MKQYVCVCVCVMRIVIVRSFKGASGPQFKANLHNVLNYVSPHTHNKQRNLKQ